MSSRYFSSKVMLAALLLAVAAIACGGSAAPANSAASPGGPYDEQANPKTDIAAALKLAQSEDKLVLLDFGADWCPDCLVLDDLYKDQQVAPYLADHFEVVRIDVGNWDHNLDVSKQYGSPIDNGIPAVVILNAQGDIVASTGDGSLANARTAKAKEILDLLQKWVADAG